MNSIWKSTFIVSCLLGITLAVPAQDAKQQQRAKANAAGALRAAAEKVDRDVTYGQAGGTDLKLDLYYPKADSKKPRAIAVYVHGGGWTGGDKAGGAGALAIPELLKRGYLVASINYRLAPQFKFPAQIEDCKCAIRFLRASAKKYDLDPNRIGVFGSSAGGHLVALLGTADETAGFEGDGGSKEQSSRVQAVVDMFGPADFSARVGRSNQRLDENVFDVGKKGEGAMKLASPVNYVSKGDAPFLILHGAKDELVPLDQSERLLAALKKVDVPAKLVVVKNAAHGFAPNGGTPDPSRAELSTMIADFFDEHLAKKP